MKFTEGYWEKNERANASYAMQAFTAEAIPGGMRIVSPFRQITDRGGALDVGTITTEFISVHKDIISVRSYHYEGYVKGEPRYELNEDPQETEVEITEDEAVMKAGRMTVRVDLKDFKITYEADGKVLTNIGFRNLGYMQYDRATLTKFPEPNYMAAQYQPYMVTELSLAPGECVYGLGERFTAFVKNGQVVDIWNEDGGTASQISYKNIPFYVTSKHYGVFVDHSDHVSFEVASEKVENVGFSVKGEEIRYHIIYGDDIKGVIENYTDLTGKPALPPAWSFGLWLSTSFTTNYDEETTNVYKRWLQFGLLSTHSRLHGSKSYRVPWLFDEEAVDVCRKFTKLKLRLLPYLYSMAVKSHKTGIPSMRAMIMEFNDDPATKYLDMQYMLGDSILVAPIFNKEGHAEYYLPAGKWTHLLSGEVKEGGRWYEEDYDFSSLPVFVRENTLLPIGAVDTTVDYELEKDVQIQVYEVNETASCEVVTRKGETAFTVKAVREGNKLTLEASAENGGMTYLLRNIHEIADVTGGSIVKDTENGIIIVPEGCRQEIEL